MSAYTPDRTTQATDDDIFAYEIAVRMMEHYSPLGSILSIVHDLLGAFHDLEGFAELALGGAININPKDALNPAFAYLVALPAWKRIQPKLAAELRELGIGQVQALKARPVARRLPAPF